MGVEDDQQADRDDRQSGPYCQVRLQQEASQLGLLRLNHASETTYAQRLYFLL